ncbi:hypothetical protein [Streptomyces luteireticuli]|uniref:hypothetical protein n=1 Tax=Streptomyces luteireticuli TaxID=173858 RepID=UPI003556F61D
MSRETSSTGQARPAVAVAVGVVALVAAALCAGRQPVVFWPALACVLISTGWLARDAWRRRRR